MKNYIGLNPLQIGSSVKLLSHSKNLTPLLTSLNPLQIGSSVKYDTTEFIKGFASSQSPSNRVIGEIGGGFRLYYNFTKSQSPSNRVIGEIIFCASLTAFSTSQSPSNRVIGEILNGKKLTSSDSLNPLQIGSSVK